MVNAYNRNRAVVRVTVMTSSCLILTGTITATILSVM